MVMSADHVNDRYDGDEEENNDRDSDVDHNNHNKPFAHFQGSHESSKSGIGVQDINDMTMLVYKCQPVEDCGEK